MDNVERTRKFNIAARKFQGEVEDAEVPLRQFAYTIKEPKTVYELTISCIRALAQGAGSTPYEMAQLLLLEVEIATEQNGQKLYNLDNLKDGPLYEPGVHHEEMKSGINPKTVDVAAKALSEFVPPHIGDDHPHAAHFFDQ